jgi:hypothetical protein
MKSGFTMMAAAAVLAGAMVVGCDKSGTDSSAPATPAAPSADSAMKSAGDKMSAVGQDLKDAGAKAKDTVTADADKLKDKLNGGATTMPSMPSMPSMK